MTLGGLNGALVIDGFTQGINNTAKETGGNRNVDDLAGMFYSIAFLDETVTVMTGSPRQSGDGTEGVQRSKRS